MIKIYEDTEKLNKVYDNIGDIYHIRGYFKYNVFSQDFDDTDLMIIRTLDKAELIADNLFKTPFGIATKEQLSSGSITALIINHWIKNHIDNMAINVISCGPNALSIIYDLVNDTSIALIQEPMYMVGATTQHEIDYNDGEFTGNIEEYKDFILCLGLKHSNDE